MMTAELDRKSPRSAFSRSCRVPPADNEIGRLVLGVLAALAAALCAVGVVVQLHWLLTTSSRLEFNDYRDTAAGALAATAFAAAACGWIKTYIRCRRPTTSE